MGIRVTPDMGNSTRRPGKSQAAQGCGCGVTPAAGGSPDLSGHTPAPLALFSEPPGASTAVLQGEPGGRAPAALSGGCGGAAPPAGAGAAPALTCQYRNNSTPRGESATAPTPKKGRLRYVAACEQKAWTLVTWPKTDPGKRQLTRFRCRSWRHEGECREWKGAQDFTRCREGIRSRSGWTYVVLTFDPKDWPGQAAAYRWAGTLWNRLRLALTRRYGRIEYIQTWEATKKGWPHVNILFHNPAIAAAGWKRFRRVLGALAVRAGFGRVLWAEPMRDADAMAGYLVKLARELTGAARKDQVPVDAPRHFRRLRASRGLLPPVFHNPEIAGELKQKPLEVVTLDERSTNDADPDRGTLASRGRSPRDPRRDGRGHSGAGSDVAPRGPHATRVCAHSDRGHPGRRARTPAPQGLTRSLLRV